MGRFNKSFLLMMIFACVLLLSGCNKIHFWTFNAEDEQTGSDIETDQDNKEAVPSGQENTAKAPGTDKDTDADKDTNPGTDPGSNTTPKPSNIQPVDNTELMIYTINMDSGEMEPKTALIPSNEKITPELIVTTVVESMADQSLNVGIDSVTTKDDTVIVSFKSNQPPLVNVGAGIEASILDAIAQSLTENLKDYSKIIYRVDGKAYVSDHYELGINEVYLGDN